MQLSDRVQGIKPSATLATTARAKALRAEGVDVLALSAGEPDFDTPENIRNAAHRAIDEGQSKYTPVPGTVELRKAVAEKTASTYGRDVSFDQVIVGAGGKQVLYNACQAILNPGDEVVFAAPFWVSYPDMARLAGAKPVMVPATETEGFTPSAEAFAAALTDKTRLLILNSPSNPTGAVYGKAHLEAIADVVRSKPNITVITDDIYEALLYGEKFVSFAQVAPDLADRTLIASGVSKTYAMTGWRIGYGIGPKDLIAAMTKLQGASTSGASSIAQAGALEAVQGDQAEVESMRKSFEQRRDRMVNALREIQGLEVFEPKGAFYVFPNVSAFYGGSVSGSQALCEHLLNTVHLAAVPGVAFGADSNIRLSFACSEADIDEGVARLGRGLESLR